MAQITRTQLRGLFDSDGIVTKTEWLDIVDTFRPCERWVGLLSQSGTDAPTAVVLENTLGGTIVWTRGTTGTYIGTLANVFQTNKTVCFAQPPQGIGGNAITARIAMGGESNQVFVSTYNSSFAGVDVFTNLQVMILLYP